MIIYIIKEFISENLNSTILLLEGEETSSFNKLVASQCNYSISVKDLTYSYSNLIFSNINSNL